MLSKNFFFIFDEILSLSPESSTFLFLKSCLKIKKREIKKNIGQLVKRI
jgi:hypothetical protein